jgi:PAS domain S-box-containing protein
MSEVYTGLATVPEAGDVSAPIWFSPHGLAGTLWAYVGFAACAAALLGVFLVGLAVPRSVETLPAALLIVVAASWLLSTRLALGVALAAIALPLAEEVFREIDPASAVLQVALFGLLATATRVYSTRLRRLLIGNVGPPTSMGATAFGLENLARLTEGSTQGVAAIDAAGGIRYANGAANELLGMSGAELAPGDFYAAVAAEDRRRVRAAFEAPGAGGDTNFTILRPDGSTRTVHASYTRVVVRKEPMVALALRDISQVSRLQRAATALAETAAGLAVTQPLAQTLAAVAQRVIEVTDAAACAVFLLEGERSVRLAASWGLPSGYEAAANAAIRAGADPPVFQAIRTGEPVFVDDLPEVIRTRDHMKPMRGLISDVTWRQAIAFPMIHAGRPVGSLSVYLTPDRRIDEPTMDFLSTIAGLAASAAEISRLVSQAQDQAAANERLHLSRELHDSLSQRLYGIILGARSIEARGRGGSAELADAIAYVLDLAQGGLTEMRDIVLQLRPEALEKEGLVGALSRHADAIGSRHQLRVTTTLAAEPDAPLEVKLAAYRIVVEALNNVAKHANAKEAWVRVELEGGRLRLEVSDDGVGFDATGTAPGHFGLATMRERAAALGAELHLSARPGGGTTVLAELPCPSVALTA